MVMIPLKTLRHLRKPYTNTYREQERESGKGRGRKRVRGWWAGGREGQKERVRETDNDIDGERVRKRLVMKDRNIKRVRESMCVRERGGTQLGVILVDVIFHWKSLGVSFLYRQSCCLLWLSCCLLMLLCAQTMQLRQDTLLMGK